MKLQPDGSIDMGDRVVANRDLEQAERELIWAGIHQHILDILGGTGGTCPMGDPNHENPPGLTTVTAMGSSFADFTYKPGTRTAFDVPMYYHNGPGRIPILTFNGMDECLDTPDANSWTHLDGSGANGFTFVFWANVITGIPDAARALFSKWGANKEYLFTFDADDKLECILRDNTVGVECSRLSDAAVPMGAMTMFAVAYSGIGGATAANYIDLYVNGVEVASSPTNDPAYVGMRNTNAIPVIGSNDDDGSQRWFTGEIAGGPLGPFWTKDFHAQATMKQLYHLGRSAMALSS